MHHRIFLDFLDVFKSCFYKVGLFGKGKKSEAVRSGEYRGFRAWVVSYLAKNCCISYAEWAGAFVVMELPLTVHLQFYLMNSTTQTPQHDTVILFVCCLTRWSIFTINNALTVEEKKLSSHLFDLLMFSSVTERLGYSTTMTDSEIIGKTATWPSLSARGTKVRILPESSYFSLMKFLQYSGH